MSVSSFVVASVQLSGDVSLNEQVGLGANSASPGKVDIVTLASGANTITVPTSGTTPIACLLVPPSGNSTALTFKGVSGDTGVRLHNTNPTHIGLDSSVTSFVLNAGSTITGLRIYWL